MELSGQTGLAGWVLRASEVPGEHDLEVLLREARALTGDEGEWARRRLEWLYRDLTTEKQALSRVFATTVLVFWALALLTERDTRNKNLWVMLPMNGTLTVGIGLRIWMCNALLRRYWSRSGIPQP